jgi:hypothetical protein
MYFQEAVKELVDGRCLGIMFNGVEYRVSNGHLGYYFGGEHSTSISTFPDRFLSDKWEVVSPIKQYEKVEVVSWKVVSGEMEGTCWDTEAEARRHGNTVVRLVGSYRKELKPKTKYREEIDLCTFGMDVIKRKKVSQYDAKVFVEWEA